MRARATRFLLASLIASGTFAVATPAAADFKVCNDTGTQVGVSIGYRKKKGWVSEGWWLVPARACATVIPGKLSSRYFYVFAEDEVSGGQWRGPIFMCTSNREYRIEGLKNCYARGFEQMGFFEVDTGRQTSWQVRLTERNLRPKDTQPAAHN